MGINAFAFGFRLKDVPKHDSSFVDLSFGENRRITHPGNIYNILTTQPGINRYYPALGLEILRQEILKKFYFKEGNPLSPEQDLIITAGAIGALDVVIRSFIQEGDEVVISDPCFPPYMELITFARGTPRFYAYEKIKNRVRIDHDSLRRSLSEKSRLLILNSPQNPTGSCLSKRDIGLITELLSTYPRLRFVLDEVYGLYQYTTYVPARELYQQTQRGFIINSFSKSYALQGLRIGWVVSSHKNLQSLAPVMENTLGCVSSIGQEVAFSALCQIKCDPLDLFRARKRAQKILDQYQLEYFQPSGGFFFLIKVPYDSVFYAKHLLKWNVKAVPGALFGLNIRNMIRVCFAIPDEEIDTGFHRLGSIIAQDFQT